MKKRERLFPILSVSCFLLICSSISSYAKEPEKNSEPSDSRELTTCKLSDAKGEEVVKLSDVITDFQIMNMDDSDEAVFPSGSPLVTDKFIGVSAYKQAYVLFDNKGKLLCKVGQLGQGPGEYGSLSYSLINEKNGKVYLAPFSGGNKLLEYSTDGTFIRDVKLPVAELRKPVFLNEKNGDFIIVNLPFATDPEPLLIIHCDKDGSLINKVRSNQDQAVSPRNKSGQYVGFNSFVTMAGNMPEITFMVSTCDTLYSYDPSKKQVKPIFAVDMGNDDFERNTPRMAILDFPGYYYIDVFGKGLYRFDKKTKKTVSVKLQNDYIGNIDESIWSIKNGWYSRSYEPSQLIDEIEARLTSGKCSSSDKAKLQELKASLDPNGPNVMLRGKLKR